MIPWIISILLIFCCSILGAYIYRMKRQLKKAKKELAETRSLENNSPLRIDLVDNDLTDFVAEINRNLEYQKRLKYESEKMSETLKQSISDIAHDMRTPLTVIKGNLQMASNTCLSEEQRAYLQNCEKQTDTLKVMVDEFFEMSVLESDSKKAEITKVNATNLLMQFIVEHEAVIRQNHLTPDILLPEKTVIVLANEQYLIRMWSNLLQNIIKYASDTFEISMECSSGRCQICFSNPLPEQSSFEIENLFERTYRGDTDASKKGMGLGLYIVKLLADKQDISINAEIKDDKLVISMELQTAL